MGCESLSVGFIEIVEKDNELAENLWKVFMTEEGVSR